MVSIVRDGRCDKLIPVCTGLEHSADLKDAAFTQTVVRDYNGADWTRSIGWLKGEFFVVIDDCVAKQDGDYTCEAVWKTLDRGEQALEEGRVFRTQIQAWGGVGSRSLVAVRNPAPGVPTAVKFVDQASQLDFGLKLPQGKYEVTLFAYGLDTGTDSFWLAVDGGETVAFHIPILKFGPSSSGPTKDTPTPNISVAQDGFHRFRLTLRENPGVMLQRVLIRDAAGKTVSDFGADQAPPLPKEIIHPAPDLRFFVKSDGAARSSLATRINNVGLKIRTLHQRFGGRLKAGERASVINLFYNDSTDAEKGYDVRRIGTRTALILKNGNPFGLFTADAQELGRGSLEPTDAALALKLLKGMSALYAPKAGTPPRATTKARRDQGFALAWRAQPVQRDDQVERVMKLCPADLDGDGKDEIIVLRGRTAACLDQAGQTRWAFATDGLLRAVAVADLERDGKMEVLIGGEDERLTILDAAGKELKHVQVDTPLRVGTSSVSRPRVSSICVGDLDGKGTNDIIVGTQNGNIARYDRGPEGRPLKRLWAFDQIEHGTRDMVLVKLDGPKLDIVAENKYGAVEIVDADGHAKPGLYSELGDVEMALGDLNGDGKLEIANGSSTGAFVCQTYNGPKLFEFPNYGYGVMDVAMVPLQPGGPLRVVIASETGYVYALEATGKPVAQRDLGDAVLQLGPLVGEGTTQIMAGCRDGTLYGLDGELKAVRQFHCGGPVTLIALARTKGKASLVVAAAGDGIVGLAMK
jgi:outer membrane protein assembly factor BamB